MWVSEEDYPRHVDSRANNQRQKVRLIYSRNSKEGTLAELEAREGRRPGNLGPSGVTVRTENLLWVGGK